jgi:GntR family transcriptional regulator/MocR family aminotransferase
MASWTLTLELDRTAGQSLTQQIAGALSADIQRGRLRPGDRLPGSRTLAGLLKVHRQTVVAAIDELVAEGWLVCRRAAGAFVADGVPDLPANRRRSIQRSRQAAPSRFVPEVSSAALPELPRDAGRALLMSGTRPDVRLFPSDLIGRYYRRSAGVSAGRLLSYNHPAGSPRMREQLARMLSITRGVALDPASIMVTRGSQMALALLARALLRPGDAVAVEHPGYRPAWEAFRLAGAEVLPVHVDDRGLDVAALRRLTARRRVRAVYVTPHHQFPTTVTLSGPRRLELLDLAARERFAVIEDDYDHEFHYSGKPVLPMASVDRAGVVAYVGTLSKVLAPGLRLGFVAGPRDLIEQLTAYRSFVDLQGDHVLEDAIARMLEDGLVQRHVRKMRRVYRGRLDALDAALREQIGDFLTFHKPSGGTAIWVRTRSTRLMVQWARAALDRGVAFDTGRMFTLNGAPAPGARLGFACLTEDEIGLAVKALAAAASVVRSRARIRALRGGTSQLVVT